MNERPPPPDGDPARPQVPLDPLLVTEGQSRGGTDDARREATAFAAGTLEEISKQHEHRRSERLRDHVSNVALCVVWVLVLLFVIATLILAWHYLMPRGWAWLDKDQLDTLRTVVFSGAITSSATGYFIKRM